MRRYGHRELERRRLLGTAALMLACSLMLPGEEAAGEQIGVTPMKCSSGVHLTARDAPLSAVLSRMAGTLGFRLRYEAEADPLLSFNATGQPGDLVTRLASSLNVSTIQARNPRCPRQMRLVEVWVLPGGSDAVAVVPPPPALPQATPMQEWQVQQGVEAHLRAHGMLPKQ